ncbi:pantothenate kinase [Helicobacter pylori]|uniref:pantothenate kinase n=1 Tax=Helicobacter pylori TaxID=210 RepID=UPI00165C6AD1|nr:pantothenate kinase [Helicobacter pylori]
MKGFVMSGLRTCVVVLCGAMVNAAIASPKIEARGQLGRDIGGGVGAGMGGAMGAYSGAEIGDRVEDFIRGVDREPQAPREPTYDRHFVYDR